MQQNHRPGTHNVKVYNGHFLYWALWANVLQYSKATGLTVTSIYGEEQVLYTHVHCMKYSKGPYFCQC